MVRRPLLLRRLSITAASILLATPPILAVAQDDAAAPADVVTTVDASLLDTITQQIESEIEAQRIVGLSAGLIIDGKVAHTLHFGFEDLASGIETSDATMYRWASISKPLTAIVAMQLADEGQLDLDADVRDLVPEFPEKPWAITARQLLCHQGGIVHYTNGQVVATEREYDRENPFQETILALDRFMESPLICEPGTRYSYTTHGYILLGAVVERAASDRYCDLVGTRIAQPLGMTTLQPDYQWVDIANRTVGYRRLDQSGHRPSHNNDVSWKLPGGGWISNVRDLALFAAGVMNVEFLPPPIAQEMWTRQTTSEGEETTYGLGFTVGSVNDILVVGHSGSQEKTRTNMLLAPQKRAGVVIMCNTEGAQLHNLTRDILRMLVDAEAGAVKPSDSGDHDRLP